MWQATQLELRSSIASKKAPIASALYLLTPPKRKISWWSNRGARGFLRMNLRIPWSDLDWREKTIMFKDCIWFEIPAKKIYFYVPRDVGDKLLVDAGRKIQSEFDVTFGSENAILH